ncbi:SUMF1/EgtB/PvdO family nonheme iron enzyme [Myxococcota bacterium]|nr:SUMF1/EgtB/PvdO family nonheme iron enzyme [Myxococcota bacterium]
MSPEPNLKLHALISSLFTAPELRAWVWLHDAARSVHDALPGEVASKDELVQALLVGLTHRGLINDALFGALVAVRPLREAEIRAVAALVGCTPRITAQGGAPLKPLSRLEQVVALEELLLERARHLRDGRFPVDLGARIDTLIFGIMAGGRPKAGEVVAKAKLIKPVGNGNFGTIWLAADEEGRDVAVKVFHLEKLGEGVMLWRFRRSIKAMSHLAADRRRPATIAPLLDVEPDGLGFSMPYLSGGNLETIGQRGWTLPVKLDCFLEICRAVAFAHQVGIIHRDIKPANVVLDASGRPVLTDFDISDIKFATKLSSAGGLGTPIFAAPEQLEEGDQADERSDVYSLGRLLHFMLLERSPGHQIEADPTLENLRAFPQALVTIVRRACQLDPAGRYPSVQQLIQDIEEHQTGWAAVRAQGRRAGRWVRMNWAVLLITSLISGGSLAGAWMQQRAAEQQRQAAEKEAALNEQLKAALAQLEELAQRLAELRARGVELSAQLEGLKSDRARITTQLEAPGLSDADRAKLQAEGIALDAQIAALVAQQELNAAKMAEAEQQLQKERERARNAREKSPPAAQEQSAPVVCEVEPRGGPTGKTYKPEVAGLDMTFVGLSGGQFCMGSPEGVGYGWERPQHPVKVSGFLLGKSEVTQAQWRAVVLAAQAVDDPDAPGLKAAPTYFKGDTLPVEKVSWCDAARFANALSRLDQRAPVYEITGSCDVRWVDGANGYRLPTEAEWEYAARAGTTTAYATGDDEAALARAGWYDANSGLKPHGVCTAPEKPWGLCDLHGNVFEWVWDGYSTYGPGEVSDPRGGGGASRVLRGGSWSYLPEYARSANRLWFAPSNAYGVVGFRLLLSSPEGP